MIFKPKIKQVLQSVLIALVALICALSINTLQTHAEDYTAWAKSIVDSIGSSNTGGNTTIQHGVWHTKTGYLCYLLDKNGNAVPGTQAVALKSPGYFEHDGARWVAISRKGNYTADNWTGTCPWNLTPWQESQGGYAATNEPEIRAYFESMQGNAQNAALFVKANWGHDMALRFGDEEVYLVIETMMHFQYSNKGTGQQSTMTEAQKEATLQSLYNAIDMQTRSDLMAEALNFGLTESYTKWNTYMQNYRDTGDSKWLKDAERYADMVRKYLKFAVEKAFNESISSTEGTAGNWILVGDPVIGTVPNLIAYKNAIGTNTPVFNSFTNKVAPFAEMIRQGDIGAQLGFIPWTGDTSSQISDDQVQTFGLAMMVISARPQGQTTADESKIPTPHAPAKESEGNYSIVKSYRTKQGTTQYIDNGTFSINNISNLITIENEKHYQVVGWKITNQTSPSVSSINWNPPGSTQAEGTTPTSVKIADPNRCLYVLLEKLEEPPTVLEPYNYKLTQSSITRRVHFSNPDNPLNNMNNPYIHDHLFTWIGVHHQISCTGHTFTDECEGHPHESDCPKACPDTCTKAHTHVAESCTDEHFCGKRCTTQTAYCSDWKWVDTHLRLSINNAQQSDYPDILATKPGWNEETSRGGLSKKYNPTSLIT